VPSSVEDYARAVLIRRLLPSRPDLPMASHAAWWAFLDCCDVLEGGRRVLLGVLPVGRVEPAPITVGTETLRRAIDDVRTWMPAWRLDELEDEWQACRVALDRALTGLAHVDEVAASTDELDDVLDPVRMLMDRLDAFADAEAAFRRRWRCPAARERLTGA
jgi:hypothetical protein